ncbi:hypothetical protein LEP1GSC008_2009 [Leptospira kirschneri serovar Bulgarica str. Nikolaevo]|uniref:Uncharacterized protein n=1 Tax=Leptospira kirschneri serovar Bulgarica str. Nikolaevo TaxID=1240687 RepID=M6EZA1_9LEPT|nr:hypothetical protein LEP1GSC008_2009 [Leptospira kirschneri serovar Bulgarica str. Nikolaevo]
MVGFFISRNHFEIEFIEQLDLNLGKNSENFLKKTYGT